MKKYLAILLILIMTISSMPVSAVRGYRSLWIECEDAMTVIQGEYKVKSDANASGGASCKLDTTKEGPHEMAINFALSYAEEYDIYILSTPGNVAWYSNVNYKINNGEYEQINVSNISEPYRTSDSRNVPVSWQKLTTTKLDRGINSISFYVDKTRTLVADLYLHTIDTIVVVPSSWNFVPSDLAVRPFDRNNMEIYYAEGTVPSKTLQQKDTFTVSVSNRIGKRTDGNPRVFAEVVCEGQTVYRSTKGSTTPINKWSVGQTYSEEFELLIPFNLPAGVYEIRTGLENVKYADGSDSALVGEIKVGQENVAEMTEYSVAISNVEFPQTINKNTEYDVSAVLKFEQELDFETKPYVEILRDNILWKVIECDTKIKNSGKVTFNIIQDEDVPDGIYSARIGVHGTKTTECEEKNVVLSGADSLRSAYYKPLSHGKYYAKRDGKTVFWYINQAGAAFYNGEAYIPMGGMFVSTYITKYQMNNPEVNEKNFLQDVEDLEIIRSRGIDDLYINPVRPGTEVPVWAWQHLLDYLEDNGWKYGIQMNTPMDREMEAYYPHATEISGRYMVEGINESGLVEVTLPKGKITRSNGVVVDSLYVAINQETGSVTASGKGTLKEDAQGNFVFTANIEIPDGSTNNIYFTPRIIDIATGLDFIDGADENYQDVKTFASKLKCGSNMRLFVDIARNEVGFYNHNENIRFVSDKFDILYREWLEDKYKSIEELNKAWQAEPYIDSFETAVALIPMYTEERSDNGSSYTYFVDMYDNSAYKIDTINGFAWNDYLDARDDLLLDYFNTAADIVKSYQNLPVLFKHCSIQRRYFINKNLVGGLDGIGCEAYGMPSKVESMSGMTTSHSMQSARTSWSIVTETSTLEDMNAKHESGKWGYPDKETLYTHFDGLMANGAKGAYDFLLADRVDLGGLVHEAYSQVHNEQSGKWFAEYAKQYDEPKKIKGVISKMFANDTYFFYPSQKNWWWKPNERTVVQLDDDNIMIKRLKTEAGKHVLQTDDVNVDTDILFVNICDGPYSKVFGPQLEGLIADNPDHKAIVVLGFRNDLGAIPSIDKYYTREKIKLSDTETVQILNPSDDAVILATTTDGKPWAMQVGDLYFVATSDLLIKDGEFETLKHVDELGITKAKRTTGINIAGFSDTVGHWAEDEIENMRRLGIAYGVGENKFMPDGNVKRAEFLSFVNRAMGYEVTTELLPEGIDESKWYADTYRIAQEKNILVPIFVDEPEGDVTRQEMAAIVAKLYNEEDVEIGFADIDSISADYLSAVKTVIAKGIMVGMPDNKFGADEKATRAQALAIINRMLSIN